MEDEVFSLGDEFEELEPIKPENREIVIYKNVHNSDEHKRYLFEIICKEIATSNKSLNTICLSLGLDVDTILRWKRVSETSPEINKELRQMYLDAKSDQADFLAEEMLEIADDLDDVGNNMARANMKKLAVETRKFLAMKLKPDYYGDKKTVDVKVEAKHELTGDEMKNLIELAKQKRSVDERNGHIEDAQEID